MNATLKLEDLNRMMAEVEQVRPAMVFLHSEYVREAEKTMGPIAEWPLFYVPDGGGGMRSARAIESKWIEPGLAYLVDQPGSVIPVRKEKERPWWADIAYRLFAGIRVSQGAP